MLFIKTSNLLRHTNDVGHRDVNSDVVAGVMVTLYIEVRNSKYGSSNYQQAINHASFTFIRLTEGQWIYLHMINYGTKNVFNVD